MDTPVKPHAVHGPRVAFTGYYGMRNFGDDLFGVICTQAAQRYWGAQPLLVGPPLQGMAGRSTVPAFYPPDWYGALGALGKSSRLLSFASAALTSDVLVMGGGSVITARESFRKPMMQAARRHRGLQLAAVGVSIGPFREPAQEEAAASFLDRFHYLSVRDQRSFEWTRRMGLSAQTHAGCDLAALLSSLQAIPTRAPHRPGDPLRIGVAPCNYNPGGAYPAPAPAAWQQAFVDVVARWSRQREVVVDVFSLNEHGQHGDAALAEGLAAQLRQQAVPANVLHYDQPDPLAMVAAIARCDAMVSARLHGAIVAWLCGVPFAIVDYHRKCRDFADDIGLPSHRRITTEQGESFSEVIIALLKERELGALSPSVYTRKAQDIFLCAPWAREHADA
jgi:polysaccharide pyruvyl transferase WcaK-like protein